MGERPRKKRGESRGRGRPRKPAAPPPREAALRLLVAGPPTWATDEAVRELGEAGFALAVRTLGRPDDLSSALADGDCDLVLLATGGENAPQAALDSVRRSGFDVPVVVVAEDVSHPEALALLRAGAAECLDRRSLWRLPEAARRLREEADAREERRRHLSRRESDRTERALEATQERLESVLASSPTVLYALAIEGESQGLTWVSRNVESLLGYPIEEALEPGWWSTNVHPDDRQAASAGVSHLFLQGRLTHEYRFRHQDGSYRRLRDDSRLRRDPQGRPVEVYGAWADVTQLYEAQSVMERAHAQLETAVSERTAELSQANQRLQFELAERRRAEEASRASEERLQTVAQATNDAVWDWDLLRDDLWWGQGVQTLFGYPPEQVRADPVWWRERVHAEDRERTLRSMEVALSDGGGGAWSAEYRFRRADGTYASVLDRGQVLRDEGGQAVRFIGSMLDISAQKTAEEALRAANEKLRAWVSELEQRNREMSLLGEMGELLQTCTALDEAYGVVAHCAQQLFQGESGALYVFRAARTLVERVAAWGGERPDEAGFEPGECWALRRGRVHVVEETGPGLRCPHVRGPEVRGYMCIPMMAQGDALGVLHLTARGQGRLPEPRRQFAQTVSESLALGLANLRLREALRSQAIRDPLTGLFNRRFMEEALEREVRRATRHLSPLSVIMLDLDRFKRLNDSLGHDAGDALLREMGAFLNARIRSADIACRYGGEEITLILPDASLDDARARAEELREGVRCITVQDRGRTIGPLTVSAGVASFPLHGSTAEALLKAADEALYRAKGAGRDRVMVAAGG
jgi:diguanylate cyclase (GGDEF)-like protein/PAS domain S-box-containing protein